jgi:pyridoxine 4-dehydrogenase
VSFYESKKDPTRENKKTTFLTSTYTQRGKRATMAVQATNMSRSTAAGGKILHPRRYLTFILVCCLFVPRGIESLAAVSSSASSKSISLGTLSVAPVSLGTLNFPPEPNDAALILQTLPPYVLMDTAELYLGGKAETILRAASEIASFSPLIVATKFAPKDDRRFQDGRQSVVSTCQESAKRLGVDKIDLYQLHYVDSILPMVKLGMAKSRDEEYWDGLADCYHSGLVGNVGVCNYGPIMVRRAHEALAKRGVVLVSNQINYNLMRYRYSMETKAVCDELGIKVLAYHPLGQGTLTGKYDPDDREKMPSKQGFYYRMKRYLKATVPLRKTLETIASKREKTCAQIAINWVVCKGAIPIVGAKDAQQANENFGAVGWSLSDEEVDELDAAAEMSTESNTVLGKEFVLD